MRSILCQLGIATALSAWVLYMAGYYDLEPEQMVEVWRKIFSAMGL